MAEYKALFGKNIFSKDWVEIESLKRFNLSSNKEFKKKLLSDEYVRFDLIDIKIILDNVIVNEKNFDKLKKHSGFNENILEILKITTCNTLSSELILIALKNHTEEIYPYIKSFITKLNIKDFVPECRKLLKSTNSINTKLIILQNIQKYLKNNISNTLLIKSYKNRFISYKLLIDYSNLGNIESIIKLIKIGIKSNKFLEINNTLLPILITMSSSLKLIEKLKEILNISEDYIFNKKLLNIINSLIEDDYDLFIDAFNKNLTNLGRYEILEKYIKDIDIKFFQDSVQHLDIKNFILKLLEKNNNQELLKFLILNFETYDFEESDYHEYFNIGKKRLIYLNEENQVIYLKKLFYLKAIGKLNFSPTELSNFITPEIIELASKENKSIDFSTFLIIDLIVNFDITGDFLGTHEIIKNVLDITTYDKTKKLKIGNYYFDECDGQGAMSIPHNNEYSISQEPFINSQGNQSSYFKVAFPYNEEIIEDIRRIKTKKYNKEGKFWGMALTDSDAVFQLAQKYSFTLNLKNGRSYVENNKHIASIKKLEKPIGIKYCCGQESQKLDSQTGREFWWCNQVTCLQNNIKTHHSEDWRNYTLFDFMNILNLSLIEYNRDGNIIDSIGLYSKFISFLNRFDRLLERLYCKECEHILYPEETSNFHKFSVTTFKCKNEQCIEIDEKVYLNNCLNGQCNEIIDSRKSNICPNGWRICNKCGSCCSHVAFERRLNNLRINGGRIYQNLIRSIEDKIGHLEKAEYFCYKCGQYMIEYSQTLYKCNDCDISYDLSKYTRILRKQIHLDFRRKDYPTMLHEIINKLREVLLEEKEELIRVGRNNREIFGILFNKDIEINGTIVSLKSLNNRALTNEIFD